MIPQPNFTQVPNVLFDAITATMNESELRVFLAIVRKTFGWSKERDRISLTQISDMTGLSRAAVVNGLYGRKDSETGNVLGGLVPRALVLVFETSKGNEYMVNVVDQEEESLGNVVDQSGQRSGPLLGNVVDTQKNSSKETIQKKEEPPKSPKGDSRGKTASPPDPLYTFLWKRFLEVTERFSDYRKEGNVCKKLCEGMRNLNPQDPQDCAEAILKKFQQLRKGDDNFWSSRPFTPCGLSPVLDQVWNACEHKKAKAEDSRFNDPLDGDPDWIDFRRRRNAG